MFLFSYPLDNTIIGDNKKNKYMVENAEVVV